MKLTTATFRLSRQLRRSLSFLATAAVLGGVAAQASPKPMRFERIAVEDGLSQNTVLSIHQDSQGFMWFGTEDGLNRFDGRSFRHYRNNQERHNSSGLASNYIRGIAEDEAGSIWIATDGGGVSRYQPELDLFTTFRHDPTDPESLATDLIQTIHVDERGAVWVGTRNRGLDRIDPVSGRVRHFRHDLVEPTSLTSDRILAITSDRSGQLWVGTANGLNRLNPSTNAFVRYEHDPEDATSLPGKQVRAIAEDRTGVLWVGTTDGGLARLDPRTARFESFRYDPNDPASLASDTVRDLLEDHAGNLWVGTVGGISLFDRAGKSFVNYSHDPADPNSLASNDVMALHQDRGGLFWVGTKSGGVSSWNPRTWTLGHETARPSNENSLSHPVVSSFSKDPLGRLWVGTVGGGLNRLDAAGRNWEYIRAGGPEGLPSDYVMSILHDGRDTMWVGTMNAGLARFDARSSTFESYRHDPEDPTSLSDDSIMSLFEDRDGNLWVGTFEGGISRLDMGSTAFRHYTADGKNPRALASPRITAFAQDHSGAIWVGTDGGGLHLLDSFRGTFHRFQHNPSDLETISSNTVYSLHVDANGTVWVGTRGGGLNQVIGTSRLPEQVSFRHYSTSEGLANSDIYGVQSDSLGHVWVSTNAGLSRFNPLTLNVKNFFRSHGLQDREFNFGAHFRSASGELFFGGVNGFNAFYPSNLANNATVPQLALTSLRVNHQESATPVAGLKEISLDHRDDSLLFEVAALDFTDPEANQYSYKLDGFDDRWIELGAERRIAFTNLEAGRYTLRVRAANSDGVWNNEGLAVGIHVAAPPWKTWWAYLCYLAAFGGAALAFVRHQQRRVEREEEYSRQLEADVRDRTAQLQDRNAELHSLNSQLLEASLTDSLTGLRNRRFFCEQVAKDIAMIRRRHYEVAAGRKQPETLDMAFLMVDLDHFKLINDGCGHAAGDQVLLEVKDILVDCCRTADIVIRWGGDEFLILARDTDRDQAAALAERIRTRIRDSVFTLADDQVVRTTCSIGMAHFPLLRSHPDAVTWEQVVQFADSAMYEAKQSRDAWVAFSDADTTLANDGVLRLVRDVPENLVEDDSLGLIRSNGHGGLQAEAQPSAEKSV